VAARVAKLILGCLKDPHFGEGEVAGSAAIVPFESAMSVSHSLSAPVHCDYCAISIHSATICYRMSPTPESTGGWVGHFAVKSGKQETDRCKGKKFEHDPVKWERHRAVVCKRNRVGIFTVCAQCTNVTDRHTDHGTVRSIAIGEIAC